MLPVPNDISGSPYLEILMHLATSVRNPANGPSSPRGVGRATRELLGFAAEGAAIGAGVQRLAAMPAEARLRRFTSLQACVDVLNALGCRLCAGGDRSRCAARLRSATR